MTVKTPRTTFPGRKYQTLLRYLSHIHCLIQSTVLDLDLLDQFQSTPPAQNKKVPVKHVVSLSGI